MIDAAALKASAARAAAAGGGDVAVIFYQELFRLDPTLREMFPRHMSEQRTRLIRSLLRIVGDVDDAELLLPYLRRLGRSHALKYGVREWHYPLVGQALLTTLAEFDPQWGDDLAAEWKTAIGVIARVMIEAPLAPEPPSVPGEDPAAAGPVVTPESVASAAFDLTPRFHRGYRPAQVEDLLALVRSELALAVDDSEDLTAQLAEERRLTRRLRDFYREQNSDVAHLSR